MLELMALSMTARLYAAPGEGPRRHGPADTTARILEEMPQHKEVPAPLAQADCSFCSLIDHFSPGKHGPCRADR
ncbi:hypothetical protein [Pseudomonas sp. LAM2023]|uniref:hypothetical protein n=1 Tax=Pseudomonas sp. LAM2023 TaxID=2800477 RepID=UPI0019096D69|nr:hypothetical protein [Pseudomonas sp. LAM2023]